MWQRISFITLDWIWLQKSNNNSNVNSLSREFAAYEVMENSNENESELEFWNKLTSTSSNLPLLTIDIIDTFSGYQLACGTSELH